MVGSISILIGLATFYLMLRSVNSIFKTSQSEFSAFSRVHFLALIMVYLVVILGFATLYLCLHLAGFPSIKVAADVYPYSFHFIGNIIYFSAMTMLSVGYGDIVPSGGITKFFAIVQALIGYLLPAAFIVSGIVISLDKTYEKIEAENLALGQEHMDKR